MDVQPRVVTVAQEPALGDRIQALIEAVWPAYIQTTWPAGAYDPIDWMGVYRRWPEFQFALLDPDGGRLFAGGNAAPLHFDGTAADLPDGGWDWALFTATAQHAVGTTPNLLCALSITIDPAAQGRGLSGAMVRVMRRLAAEAGLARLIAPVRPTWKNRYPLIPMATYAAWTTADGLPFDPWLRTHVRTGGRIVKPCLRSMSLQATVAGWEASTGLALPGSGHYTVPALLAPLQVNRDADRGVYVEPNVWVEHLVGR